MTKGGGLVETVYLLTAAESGWLALATMLWWFAYMWWLNFRNLSPYAGLPQFYLPAGFAGGMAAVFLQSVLEWVLKQSINFTQLMVIFAMVSVLYTLRRTWPDEQRKAMAMNG